MLLSQSIKLHNLVLSSHFLAAYTCQDVCLHESHATKRLLARGSRYYGLLSAITRK